MKYIFYLTLSFALLISCKQKTKSNQVETTQKDIPYWMVNVDTVLERNSPISLDLSKHQLYIDTTRNSEIYRKIINKPIRTNNEAISYYLKEHLKRYKSKKVNLKKFPRHWISLKKLNGEFVIYEPCDGSTPSYEINDSSVVFYGQLEGDADLIFELKNLQKDEITLELRTFPQKTKSEKAILTIKPTDIKNVYVLTYSFDEFIHKTFVTPNERVSEFDIIVNHCPTTKRREFRGFDKE